MPRLARVSVGESGGGGGVEGGGGGGGVEDVCMHAGASDAIGCQLLRRTKCTS